MKIVNLKSLLASLLIGVFCFYSCQKSKEKANSAQVNTSQSSNEVNKAYYEKLKKEANKEDYSQFENSSEEDNSNYDPNSVEANVKLVEKGRVYTLPDNSIEIHFDMRDSAQLGGKPHQDTIRIGQEKFVRDVHNVTALDVQNFHHNLEYVKEVKSNSSSDGNCSGKDCPVYAHVNKEKQRLYLYINGDLVDTFKTSTARKGYTTPDFDKKPDGRIYDRYSSHKYHGGNWNGYGNMPFAVFVSGGYAIHGATSGEIRELGHPASHGCIRIHPKNARLFNRLVRFAGVENTWVHID